ncbi:MAG: hybrid sensor histidine kinase/response regulator, partial [Betaproteobacteria bacterium HGW-Betaproteobacteria-21]
MPEMNIDVPKVSANADRAMIRRAVWRVVLPYAIFAALWIVLSDRVVEWLAIEGAPHVWLQTFKGWFFVTVTALLLYGLVHRMLLRITEAGRRQHEEQARRLQALSLLNTIANSSTDCIFAKDLQGRYLLFNKAAEALTGKSSNEVLGQDDHVLFPPEQAVRVMANDREVIAG